MYKGLQFSKAWRIGWVAIKLSVIFKVSSVVQRTSHRCSWHGLKSSWSISVSKDGNGFPMGSAGFVPSMMAAVIIPVKYCQAQHKTRIKYIGTGMFAYVALITFQSLQLNYGHYFLYRWHFAWHCRPLKIIFDWYSHGLVMFSFPLKQTNNQAHKYGCQAFMYM